MDKLSCLLVAIIFAVLARSTLQQSTADGSWSTYEENWGPCSRTCGGGVRLKRRYCTLGPNRNGCPGSDVTAQMCNTQPCATSNLDFLNQQCAATNIIASTGTRRYYEWEWNKRAPDYQQCELWCKAKDSILARRRSSTVTDGTECRKNSRNWGFEACLEGTCRVFGCDGVLNSDKYFDVCGTCQGNGDKCQRTMGNVTSGIFGAHMTFLSITGPATSIKAVNKNYFNVMAVKVNGSFEFNANVTKDGKESSGTFEKNGVVISYEHGSGDEVVIIRQLPIGLDVELAVFQQYDERKYADVSPEISFEYYTSETPPIKSNETTPQPPSATLPPVPTTYKWITTDVTSCSKSCGTGWRYVNVTCVTQDDKDADENSCDETSKPSSLVICNDVDCPPSWELIDSDCHTSCKNSNWTCAAKCILTAAGHISKEVDPSNCTTRKQTVSCDPKWRVSTWSTCSTKCGIGKRTRTVECFAADGSKALDPSSCKAIKPVSEDICKVVDCRKRK